MELKVWTHPHTGEVRYYLDGWTEEIAGLTLNYNDRDELTGATHAGCHLDASRARGLLAAIWIDESRTLHRDMNSRAWANLLGGENMGAFFEEIARTCRHLLDTQGTFPACPYPTEGKQIDREVLQLRPFDDPGSFEREPGTAWEAVGRYGDTETAGRAAETAADYFGRPDSIQALASFEGEAIWQPGPLVPTLWMLRREDEEDPTGWEYLGFYPTRELAEAALKEHIGDVELVVRSYPDVSVAEYPGAFI